MTKRLLVAGLALGLVAALGAGIGVFLAVRGTQYSGGPVECGGVNRCIPDLEPAAVVDALKSQGHECAKEGTVTWTCRAVIGLKRFEMSLEVSGDLINSYLVRVSTAGGDVGGDTTTSYLVWLASLPYANDPVLLEQIKTWVAQHVDGTEQTEVRIGDYSYEMDASRKDAISLDVRGRLHQ